LVNNIDSGSNTSSNLLITDPGTTFSGGQPTIGPDNRNGTLTISNGGSAQFTGTLVIADTNATGNVYVTDPGSTLICITTQIGRNINSNGLLSILNDANVSLNGVVQLGMNANGSIIVDGIKSSLFILSGLNIGRFTNGLGTLTVSNDARVSVNSNITFGVSGGKGGIVNFYGGNIRTPALVETGPVTFNWTGGTLNTLAITFTIPITNNGGTLAPGFSQGTLNIQDDYIQVSGQIQIEIFSTNNFDQVSANAIDIRSGRIFTDLDDDYDPQLGDEFKIFHSTKITVDSSVVIGPNPIPFEWSRARLESEGIIELTCLDVDNDGLCLEHHTASTDISILWPSGNVPIAKVAVNSLLVSPGQTLRFEIRSTQNYDSVSINDTLFVSGTVQVTLNGYSLTLGDQFNFVDATTISCNMEVFDTPSPGLTTGNIFYTGDFCTNGTMRVSDAYRLFGYADFNMDITITAAKPMDLTYDDFTPTNNIIANDGIATVNILDQPITSDRTTIARQSGSVGTLSVSGNSASFFAATQIQFGSGDGNLNFSGGLIKTPLLTSSDGTFTFNWTGGTLNTLAIDFTITNNGGTLAPGFGQGTVNIQNSYIQTAGRVQIELFALNNFDQVKASTINIQTGQIFTDFQGGYVPNLFDEFKIFDATSITVSDSVIINPEPSPYFWSRARLETEGIIEVICIDDDLDVVCNIFEDIEATQNFFQVEISGNALVRAITINGTQTLEFEIFSDSVYDQLSILETFVISTNLVISTNVSLSIGSEFKIISTNAWVGQFNSVKLSKLNNNLVWDLSQLYNNGIIKVIERPFLGSTGLLLWWEANDRGAISTENSVEVKALVNKAGGDFVITQNTPEKRPTLSSGILFDGNGDAYLSIVPDISASQTDIIIVYSTQQTGPFSNDKALLGHASNQISIQNNLGNFVFNSLTIEPQKYLNYVDRNVIANFSYSLSGDLLPVFNGRSHSTLSLAPGLLEFDQIGQTNLDPLTTFNGTLLEIIIFDDTISKRERLNIENYLRRKWKILLDRDYPFWLGNL